jgi:signal transduction histidine kinase
LRLGAFVTRPLRRLESAAAAVGEGDLAARAPFDEGPPEVRSLAAVFNATVAKLEQSLRSQREFVADASHQLRTPLTALRLRLENPERDVSPTVAGELDAAVGEVDRLAALVDDLLGLARADAQVERQSEAVDARTLASERVKAWSALAGEHRVALELRTNGGGIVQSSPERLRHVLDNLIENAIEASPEGGTVSVTVSHDELRIADDGPGLDAAERERAFDRFWRGRVGEGSGLGLAIVKRLVELDGGTVTLEPRTVGGLEAIVRLRAPT